MREDYSDGGNAWDYFTHDQARSRAYRWGEDGLAGISDDQQRLCFALALWNGKDPILKERLFGLTNSEGNHGEDVKEYYFYLDSTPTHSYMKYLYKYPQAAYPVCRSGRDQPQPEPAASSSTSCSTPGVFDEDRYFDVFVEYAKASPEDMLIQITVHNRGPEAADAARAADAVVPQPVVLAGAARPAASPSMRRRAPERRSQAVASGSSANAICTATATPRCCSPKTKPTRSASSACPTAARTSRTASTTTSSTASRTR